MSVMTGMLGAYMQIAMPFILENIEREVDAVKEKDVIRQKWQDTKNFPRKMKKRVRKELNIAWEMACWGTNSMYDFSSTDMFNF